MSIRVELLKRGILENMRRNIEELENEENKTTESVALDILYEIHKILCNEEYDDSEALNKIACIFEEIFETDLE